MGNETSKRSGHDGRNGQSGPGGPDGQWIGAFRGVAPETVRSTVSTNERFPSAFTCVNLRLNGLALAVANC